MTVHLPTPLVDIDWLAQHLDHPQLRIVDASWYLPSMGRNGRAEFDAAHIPGAIFGDLELLADETALYPHTMPAAEVLAARLGALGIGNDSLVVVYDSSGQHFSARGCGGCCARWGTRRSRCSTVGLARGRGRGTR